MAVTVGLIFSICPMCYVWPSWWRMAYVAITVGLSQIGWPIVQVSHLAMIPEIARKQKDRNQLSSLKNSAQFISYIITFFITFFVLRSGRESANEKTSPHDAYRFRVSIFDEVKFLFVTIFTKKYVFLCSAYH